MVYFVSFILEHNHVFVFLSFNVDCTNATALGMESKAIADAQISASSENSPFLAKLARLNLVLRNYTGWRANTTSGPHWFQVNFLQVVTVTEIDTQGVHGTSDRIESYTISHSVDGVKFEFCIEDGGAKVGRRTAHLHPFKSPWPLRKTNKCKMLPRIGNCMDRACLF